VLAPAGIFCEVSASRITNTACKFVIPFRIPSGNSPDRVSFHSNSICRSLASHCATVLSAGDVFVYVGTARRCSDSCQFDLLVVRSVWL